MSTVQEYASYAERVRQYAQESGRDPNEIGFAFNANWYDDQQAQIGRDGERKTFTGEPEQIADDVRSYEELGVTDLMLGLQGNTLDETFVRLERFVENVKPLVM